MTINDYQECILRDQTQQLSRHITACRWNGGSACCVGCLDDWTRCFTVFVSVDLSPRPKWITCCLVQNAARRGFTQAACSPSFLQRTVSVNHSGCQLWAQLVGFVLVIEMALPV